MPALSSLDEQQQQSIKENHIPLTVEPAEMPGCFTVRGTVYYGGCLISAAINITNEGRLSFEDRQLLLRGIHFPRNAVNYYWMGEQ